MSEGAHASASSHNFHSGNAFAPYDINAANANVGNCVSAVLSMATINSKFCCSSGDWALASGRWFSHVFVLLR